MQVSCVKVVSEQESKWLRFFSDPTQWWDNRSKKAASAQWNAYPDFKNASTMESLWISSSDCPEWVHEKIKSLENPLCHPSKGIRVKYRDSALSYTKQTVYPSKSSTDSLPRAGKISRILSDIKQCTVSTGSKDLQTAKLLHLRAVQERIEDDRYVSTALVDMFVKCVSLRDARAVFDKIQRPDTFAWNALMLGYASAGDWKTVLELFRLMQERESCVPDNYTFVAVFKSVAAAAESLKTVEEERVKFLRIGVEVHGQAAAKNGLDTSNIFVGNTLIDMYAKLGEMELAKRTFGRMIRRDTVSWNNLMLGYAEQGDGETALEMLGRMNSPRTVLTYVAALKACSSPGSETRKEWLEKGIALHSQARESGYDSHILVACTLVHMYGKCGSIDRAQAVFDRIPCPNTVCWNALLFGYAENGQGQIALELFSRMKSAGCDPTPQTYVAALLACGGLAEVEEAQEVDGKLLKVKSLETGSRLREQAEKSFPGANDFISSSLISMYSKCGSMSDARAVFDGVESGHRDVAVWNALLMGYVKNEESETAVEMFKLLEEKRACSPNARTLVAVLMACASVGSLNMGRRLHRDIQRLGYHKDVVVVASLIDLYAKCGSVAAAQQVFQDSAKITSKSLITWNALLSGYALQADTEQVFRKLEQMQKAGVKPDSVTFVSLLSACSHAGEAELGKECFRSMSSVHGLEPVVEHYTCMVDMLGRANMLKQALDMMKHIPDSSSNRDVAVAWRALLGSCRKWKNVEVGKLAFEKLLELDGRDCVPYLLMEQIYGGLGMWEEHRKVEAMRVRAKAWKRPTWSWWTDGDNVVHAFAAGYTRHNQSEKIYEKLSHVYAGMKSEGYKVDVDSLVDGTGMSRDEKEDALCGHSERLAIACALINTMPGETIRIMKNLRCCDDCHTATAFISKVERREIVFRDANRFHVFKDGTCSCEGFW